MVNMVTEERARWLSYNLCRWFYFSFLKIIKCFMHMATWNQNNTPKSQPLLPEALSPPLQKYHCLKLLVFSFRKFLYALIACIFDSLITCPAILESIYIPWSVKVLHWKGEETTVVPCPPVLGICLRSYAGNVWLHLALFLQIHHKSGWLHGLIIIEWVGSTTGTRWSLGW